MSKVDLPSCEWCERTIALLEGMVCVCRCIQQINPDGTATVIDATDMVYLCGECGNQLDHDALGSAIRDETYRLKHPRWPRPRNRIPS